MPAHTNMPTRLPFAYFNVNSEHVHMQTMAVTYLEDPPTFVGVVKVESGQLPRKACCRSCDGNGEKDGSSTRLVAGIYERHHKEGGKHRQDWPDMLAEEDSC